MFWRKKLNEEIRCLKESIEYLNKEVYRLKNPPFKGGTKVAIFDCNHDGYFVIGIVGGYEDSKIYQYGYNYHIIIGDKVENRDNVFLYDPKIHRVKK